MFQTQISAIDENIVQGSYSTLKPFFVPSSENLTFIALFNRGRGIDFLKFTKMLIQDIKSNENQEFFVHSMWDKPSDWNQYFSLIRTLKFPETKVFLAGKNCSMWQKAFPEQTLHYSIAHMPDYLSIVTEKKGSSLAETQNLIMEDIRTLLKIRMDELKNEGNLILFIDLEHEKSLKQLVNRATKLLESNESLSSEEKSKTNFNCVFHNQETIESALKEFSDKFQVIHNEVITMNLEIDKELKSRSRESYENYTNWVKEKLGSQIYYNLDPDRKFEEKQGLMADFFEKLNSNFKQNPLEVHQKSQILLLKKTLKIN